jgi:tight adherence protein C
LAAALVGGAATALAFSGLRLVWRFPGGTTNKTARTAQEKEGDSDGKPAPVETLQQAIGQRVLRLAVLLMTAQREEQLAQRLTMMGETRLTPAHIVIMQLLCCIGALLFMGAAVIAIGISPVWIIAGGGVGWLFPLAWIHLRIQDRHLEIGRTMPFNLDLLTLSVEAGLDFGGAVNTVVDKGLPGPFNEELGLMLREMRMGKTREAALRQMAQRVNYPPLNQFVANLVQADRMGSSLGRVLRIQSGQLRTARTQRAERLANEAPVKMLFPLIFCIFPTVFMILFGPIVYQFVHGGV